MKFKPGDVVQYKFKFYGKSIEVADFSDFNNKLKALENARYNLSNKIEDRTIYYTEIMEQRIMISVHSDLVKYAKNVDPFPMFYTIYTIEDLRTAVNHMSLNIGQHTDYSLVKDIKKPWLTILDSHQWPAKASVGSYGINIYKISMISPDKNESIIYAFENWLEDWEENSYAKSFDVAVKGFTERMRAKFAKKNQ